MMVLFQKINASKHCLPQFCRVRFSPAPVSVAEGKRNNMNAKRMPRCLPGLIFFSVLLALTYCFFRFFHPLVLLSLDDWAYYGYSRLAIPFPGFWNPSRVLPETLMPLSGEMGALLFAITGDYVKAQIVSLALVFSLCIVAYVYCFYRLVRKQLRLEHSWAMLLSLAFLLLHFLIFRSQSSGNVHLFYETDVVCVFYYTIPAMLNGALIMLDLADGLLVSLLRPGKLLRKAMLVLVLYLAVFSNLFGSVLFASYVGVRLLAALLRGLHQRQKAAVFLGENLSSLLVLACWLVSALFESMGGRASVSDWSAQPIGARLVQAVGYFGMLCKKLSPLFLAALAAALLFALILLLLRKKDPEGHRSLTAPLLLFGCLAVLCLAFLLLLGAVVNPAYLLQPGTVFPFFFFLPLGFCWCLGYALARWPRLRLLLPIALLVILSGITTRSRAFADYNSMGFSARTCMEINYDLIAQVQQAQAEGKQQLALQTMDTGEPYDNWPHSTIYLGDTLSDLFYKHGLVSEYIRITIEPSQAFNEAHGLRIAQDAD